MEQYNRLRKAFIDNGFIHVDTSNLNGKEKCNYLKSIRKKYCKDNNILIDIPECNFSGECCGTCLECEKELRIINDFRIHRGNS